MCAPHAEKFILSIEKEIPIMFPAAEVKSILNQNIASPETVEITASIYVTCMCALIQTVLDTMQLNPDPQGAFELAVETLEKSCFKTLADSLTRKALNKKESAQAGIGLVQGASTSAPSQGRKAEDKPGAVFHRKIHEDTQLITSIAFSPNSELIATCSESGQMTIHNVASIQEEARLILRKSYPIAPMTCVALSNTYLLVGSSIGIALGTDLRPLLERNEQIRDFKKWTFTRLRAGNAKREASPITSVDISHDGKLLITCDEGEWYLAVPGPSGMLPFESHFKFHRGILGRHISKFCRTNSDLIAMGKPDGKLRVYSCIKRRFVHKACKCNAEIESPIKTLEWSPGGENTLCAANENSDVVIWDLKARKSKAYKPFYRFLFPNGETVHSADYHFPSPYLLTSSNNSWRVTSILTGTVHDHRSTPGPVDLVRFAPDGQTFVTVGRVENQKNSAWRVIQWIPDPGLPSPYTFPDATDIERLSNLKKVGENKPEPLDSEPDSNLPESNLPPQTQFRSQNRPSYSGSQGGSIDSLPQNASNNSRPNGWTSRHR